MNKLIKFLEENNASLELKPNKFKDFVHVAEVFNYDFIQHSQKSSLAVLGFLKEKIRKLLVGSDYSQLDFDYAINHLAYNYFSSDCHLYEHALKLLVSIKYFIGAVSNFSFSEKSFLEIKDCLEAAIFLSNSDMDLEDFFLKDQKLIAESIKYLRKKQYGVVIQQGNISLTVESEKRFFSGMEYRFKKLGEYGLRFTISLIGSYYCDQDSRYYFRSEPNVDSKLDIPIGYLFNLSLANLHQRKKQREFIKIYGEALELAKHYFAIQRLQTLNKFSDINHRYDSILPAIRKNILYDQYFSLDQIDLNHVTKIIIGMFDNAEVKSLGINLELYLDILDWLALKTASRKTLIFTLADLENSFLRKYTKTQLEGFLEDCSIAVDAVNKGYLAPNKINKRNYFTRPFIKIEDRYLFIDPLLSSFGFYSAIENICKTKGLQGGNFGDFAEELVKQLLVESNIKFHFNKKYKVSAEIRNELKIKSQERECDFIIETEKTIIFIELKRKTLTAAARSGDELQSLLDISQSFFHATTQAGCHEYTLRKQGSIQFSNGGDIQLCTGLIETDTLIRHNSLCLHWSENDQKTCISSI